MDKGYKKATCPGENKTSKQGKCSPSGGIQDMQIKTAIKAHFISIKLCKTLKYDIM